MTTYRLGVDVGGTFTDAVLVDEDTGEIWSTKVLTTADDLSVGVMEAIQWFDLPMSELRLIIHGYTAALNALLTRSGSKTGLLTTHGMRDLMDTGRLWRGFGKHLMNPRWRRPLEEQPLIERRLRRDIDERIAADGSVVVPLDGDEVRRELEFLKDEGVETVAIMFFNSYTNLDHELEAGRIAREVFPDGFIQTSAINPVSKEYERQTTVAVGAYTGKIAQEYLSGLGRKLDESGYDGDVLILQITGGAKSLERVAEDPLWALYSGPVGGALGAQAYGKWLSIPNLVTLDLGGTSMDTSIIADHEVTTSSEMEVQAGVTVMLPHMEVVSVGAGGGSLIYTNDLGNLNVGPESAGSVPGPVCYGRGGEIPTLSDAFLQMGLLHAERFLGGRLLLDRAGAEQALATVGSDLDMSATELAGAAYELATIKVAEAIRTVTLYRGIELNDFSLFAYGSAGPIVAADVARVLSVDAVLVPIHPGCFSAFGMATADMRVDYSSAPMRTLSDFSPDELDAAFRELESKAVDDLLSQGADRESVEILRAYHGMYTGQSYDNRIPAPPPPYEDKTLEMMTQDFHNWYHANYGYMAEELQVIVTQLTATAVYRLPGFDLSQQQEGSERPAAKAIVDVGQAYIGRNHYEEVPYFDRIELVPANVIEGPAVILEDLATTVVPDRCTATVGGSGELRMSVI